MSDQVKTEWKCECGQVLGFLLRTDRRVTGLAIVPGFKVKIEGTVTRVMCPTCGRWRGWVPGKEALRELMGQCGALAEFDALEARTGNRYL